jgi:hypothetical protein
VDRGGWQCVSAAGVAAVFDGVKTTFPGYRINGRQAGQRHGSGACGVCPGVAEKNAFEIRLFRLLRFSNNSNSLPTSIYQNIGNRHVDSH